MKNISSLFIIIGTVLLFCITFFSQRQIRIWQNTFPYWAYVDEPWHILTCINRTDKDWLLPSDEYDDSMIVVHPGEAVPLDETDKPWPYPDSVIVELYGKKISVEAWGTPTDSFSPSYVLIGCNGDTADFMGFNLKGELARHWKYNLLTDTCIVEVDKYKGKYE